MVDTLCSIASNYQGGRLLPRRRSAPRRTARRYRRVGRKVPSIPGSRAFRGVKADPGVADREFAERLGICSADEFEAEFDPETSEVIDGRVRSAWSERAQGSTIEVDRPILSFTDEGSTRMASSTSFMVWPA
jgi:hypothetical protein